jgi:hypothetical protein
MVSGFNNHTNTAKVSIYVVFIGMLLKSQL